MSKPGGSTTPPEAASPGWIQRFLDTVEWLGNLLPHPVTLFALFALAIILGSGIAEYFGLSALDPRPVGAAGRAADGVIRAVSLTSVDGLQRIVSNLVLNFTSFPPLGVVLVAMLGVSIAEHSGLIAAVMQGLVMGASRRMVTITVVFAGVVSNVAAELGYVVLIPLAAVIFHSLGRHPIAGLAAAFAGVSGGYSANLFIGTIDPLLAGLTQSAANLIDPTYTVGPECNWYFMAASSFLIAGLGALVTETIVEPKLGTYNPADATETLDQTGFRDLSTLEKRGLLAAALGFVGIAILLALSVVPDWGPLRHPQTGAIAGSPFLHGVVAFIFVSFAVPGFLYGKIVGTMRNDRDVISAMGKSMSSMGLYIVLVFFAAQFVAFFAWSNLGTIFAVLGANFLKDMGLTGPLLFFCFILVCAFVNLMIGSASAQWAISAPIFVPMLMLVGYSPEVIQAAYRIGDSVTNIITPMMSYFGLILAVATRYKGNLGMGTLIATMLPYSFVFFIGWTTFFLVWVFVLGWPVGPGSPTHYGF